MNFTPNNGRAMSRRPLETSREHLFYPEQMLEAKRDNKFALASIVEVVCNRKLSSLLPLSQVDFTSPQHKLKVRIEGGYFNGVRAYDELLEYETTCDSHDIAPCGFCAYNGYSIVRPNCSFCVFFASNKSSLVVGGGKFDWEQFFTATGREPAPFEAFAPVRCFFISKTNNLLPQEQHGDMAKPDFFYRYDPETERDEDMRVPSTLRRFN